ncbi:hypothetical protein MHU86_14994 [Fragilaria crotonensis]|nr:hypothetical protein MHU86_14994 [Fragilaria crotonensis]
MELNEEEIVKLELELTNLQERECQRHREMMEKRRTMSCVATMIRMNAIGASGSFESSGNDSSAGGTVSMSTPRNERKRNDDMTPTSDIVRTLSDVDNTCMECEVIPTNHLCLKCKVLPRVCACCCDENRGLRNNTWCSKGCFDNETPTTQQIIRDGEYNYK